MNFKIDVTDKKALLEHLDALRSFIEHLEDDASCETCLHWDQGCKKSGGAMPPSDVINKGCKQWVVWDEIPYL